MVADWSTELIDSVDSIRISASVSWKDKVLLGAKDHHFAGIALLDQDGTVKCTWRDGLGNVCLKSADMYTHHYNTSQYKASFGGTNKRKNFSAFVCKGCYKKICKIYGRQLKTKKVCDGLVDQVHTLLTRS